ncbi:MAG: neutral/alkaline non-lysosomal ceramidase N-terminal domain-containing protein [Gemmataceae bacterium]
MLPILLLLLAADDKPWKAGVAVRVITPPATMWMAGYASRKSPAEGKEHDLYAKALAVEDPSGRRAVLVTTDLIGIPRSLAVRVRADAKKRLKLDDAGLMLTASHTHCGPVVADNLIDMYPMPPDEAKKVGPYTDRLAGLIGEAIAEAVGKLAPARLSTGLGKAAFAVNRREVTATGITNGRNPGGPVDHDVPVLRVTSPDGKLIAAAFGYACHNTTLPFMKWCGDYAGFAQEAFEAKHPGAVALFWAGCGADANPLPRGKVDLARGYGRQLADAVEAVTGGKMADVTGPLTAAFQEIPLPYDKLPTKEQVAGALVSKNLAERKRAERLAEALKGGGIDPDYKHYPVQVWKLGGVTWVALGGEVVVDYSLRLKKEMGPGVWVAGYANDVMAYVGSGRILKEGGYEADSSVVYYGLPARWSATIEDKIVDAVKALAK